MRRPSWGRRAVLGTKILSICTQASPSPRGTTATSLGFMLLPHWASLLTSSAGLENTFVNLLLPGLHLCYTSIQVPKPSCSVTVLSWATYNCFGHCSVCSEGLHLISGASQACLFTTPAEGLGSPKEVLARQGSRGCSKSSSEISSQPHSLVHHTGPSPSTPRGTGCHVWAPGWLELHPPLPVNAHSLEPGSQATRPTARSYRMRRIQE